MISKTKGVCLLHTNTIAGVAHQTSEKQKPGPLDLTLLFREVVEVKKGGGNGASTREILFSSIAEYNKSCTNKVGPPKKRNVCPALKQLLQAWRVNEQTRRLLYGLLRCPYSMIETLKSATEHCAWKDSGWVGQIMINMMVFNHHQFQLL